MIIPKHHCGSREAYYLLDKVHSLSLVHMHQVHLKPPGTCGWALRVSSQRDGLSFDLEPPYVGGLFVFGNRRAQMSLSPHATWECGTHSTTVQTTK